MIGLILGTSEGRNIVKLLNEFTANLLISTATSYGGDILKELKYKVLNTDPLDSIGLKQMLIKHDVSVLVDATHPYATLITDNCKSVCEDLNILYLRYERPSVCDKYKNCEKVIYVSDYEELVQKIKSIHELQGEDSIILNTTGSRNINKLVTSDISNRIVHRVLPSVEVMKQCIELGVKVEDIVAIKGPIGYELNIGFIRQYNAKAMILKDSGILGGTKEKMQAALHENIYVFVIERRKELLKNIYHSEEQLVNHIIKNNLY